MSVLANPKSTASSIKGSSQLSASESAVSSDEDVRAQQFEENYIFPLFSEISRVVRLPSVFYIGQFLIQALQVLSANMYIGNHHIWGSISSVPKALRIISYFVNFGVVDLMNKNNKSGDDSNITNDDFFDCYPLYIAVVVYFVVEALFLIYILYWYRKKRSFMKWTLYVAYYLLSVLNPIVFTPTCGIAGYAVWQIDSHQSMSSIVYLIISIIPAILILALTIWNSNFTCYSVYISRNIDASWDPRVKNIFTITVGATSFLSPALNPFPKWFVFVGFVIGIVLNFYQLMVLYYLPLIKPLMNEAFGSLSWLSIAGLIVTIVNFFKDPSTIVLIIVPIIVFVVCFILYIFGNRFRINNALSKMNIDQEDFTEKEKKEFLETINLGTDSMAVFFVRIGISHLSPLCVDFSFLKYLANVRQSNKVLFSLINITAMIPGQMQFLSQLIATVSRSGTIFSTVESYILYQARKVHVIRQSVSSKEERSDAKLLYKMSEETISLVRGFWGEISHTKGDISTASLRYFRNSSMRTSSSYLDALDQFPRSQKIYDQYIRFLIEAMGDYKSSIHYSKNLRMIEKGHRVVHDHAFRSFANTFPRYLTENILDSHGMYVNNKDPQFQLIGQNQTTEFMSMNNSSTSSNSLDSTDFRNNDIASDIFEHSKLRLALQEVIDKSSMKSLNILRAFSISSLILILVIFIILISVFSSAVKSPYELMESCKISAQLSFSLQYASLIAGTKLLEYTSSGGNTNTGSDSILNKMLISQLSINISDLPQEPSAFYQPNRKLNMIANELKNQLHQELDIVFSNPSKHIAEIECFGHWNSSDFYTLLFGDYAARLSLRASIFLFLTQIEYISSIEDIGSDYSNVAFCVKTCYNGFTIGQGFDELFESISLSGINECERYANIFDVITYVISIVAVVLFLILRIVNFVHVIKEFNTLSSLLRGFSKDDMEASSKPIYLKSKEKLPTGTVHSAHDFSIEVFIIPLIFILITLDCVIVVIYTGILNQDFFDAFADAFEWANAGSQRALTLMKLLTAITIDHSKMADSVGSTNESTLHMQDNIDTITKFQNLLDLEIIGKDDRFDTFYYSDRCESITGTYNYARFIDCISLSNKINLATSYFNMMKKEYEQNQIFRTFEFAGIAYSIDKTVYKDFLDFQEYLLTYTKNISDEHNQTIEMVCIIGIVILVILFAIENFFINMLYNSFAGFKQLIYTLPPVSVCQNRTLMNFLSRMKTKDELPSEGELIINASNFGIITINENLIIQTVNPVFIKMTGISSHKLLGQSITWLVPLPLDEKGNITFDKSPFYCAIDEMRNNRLNSADMNNNDNVRTVKIKIRKQNLETLHMSANLIQTTDDKGSFKGIAILLKDIEEIVELKKKLQQEKNNTQQLLNVLIPSGALSSVKGKKQSVLFKADIATVMFIEITGISECISMMSPKGLMDILEQIYTCIDDTIKKYNSISMIRWENEMLFAVSGLFSFVGNYKKQAQDTASFLLEITNKLEEINIQVNTDFHLRLGAHIGGPVMGFVQNPDTPCFDIRSGTFKYMNYMKEKDCIDQVQMTESVVKYLDSSILEITKNSTFEFEDGSEDVYTVKYKDGYKPPQHMNEEEEYHDGIQNRPQFMNTEDD